MSKVLFDPSVTSDNDLSHNFRVFTDQDAKCADPGYQKHPLVAEHAEETTAHKAGSCVENGYDNAQAGSGVWFGPDDPRNVALKIPGLIQSNISKKQVSSIVLDSLSSCCCLVVIPPKYRAW